MGGRGDQMTMRRALYAKSKEQKVPQMREKTRRGRIYSLAFGAVPPVTALLCALCLSAEAQQPAKVPRIGYLSRLTRLPTLPVPRQFGWLCASLAT